MTSVSEINNPLGLETLEYDGVTTRAKAQLIVYLDHHVSLNVKEHFVDINTRATLRMTRK